MSQAVQCVRLHFAEQVQVGRPSLLGSRATLFLPAGTLPSSPDPSHARELSTSLCTCLTVPACGQLRESKEDAAKRDAEVARLLAEFRQARGLDRTDSSADLQEAQSLLDAGNELMQAGRLRVGPCVDTLPGWSWGCSRRD